MWPQSHHTCYVEDNPNTYLIGFLQEHMVENFLTHQIVKETNTIWVSKPMDIPA